MAEARSLYDAHFQRNFLAFLVRDSLFLDRVARTFSPELLSDDYSRRIAFVALSFYRKERTAPDTNIFRLLDSLRQEGVLKDDVHSLCSTLADELFAIPLHNRSFLLHEYDKFLKHQRFETLLPEVVDLVRKGKFDDAEDGLKKIFAESPTADADLGTEYTDAVEARCARREAQDEERFWLLIPPIDKKIDGLRRGEIGVWQSQRSSSGKSAALAHCAKAFALQGKTVVIYTLEMGVEAYEDRLDQAVGALTKKGLADENLVRIRVQSILRNGGKIVVKAFPGYTTKCSDLRNHCKMLEAVRGYKVDAVLIDYADLLAPESDELRGDLYATGAEVYSYWRAWMGEERKVGWTGMQSGRDAMNERFADQMHAAGSIAKIQIADLVLSINRTPEEEISNVTRVHVVKSRESKARYDLIFPTDFDRMQFWDASRDEDWKSGAYNEQDRSAASGQQVPNNNVASGTI